MWLAGFWLRLCTSCMHARHERTLTMAADAGKPSKRTPLEARPRADVDREKLRADISERFSETLEYLAK
jgi:hypothetical protein